MKLCISSNLIRTLALAIAVSLLAACGGGRGEGPATAAITAISATPAAMAEALPSAGQVKPVPAVKMSSYAAARATDQVSFGATPALVSELQQQGLPAWIEGQLAAPVSQIAPPSWVTDYAIPDPIAERRANRFHSEEIWRRALSAPDQL